MNLGDPRLPPRFWSKVAPVGECWEWLGCTRYGYGAISWECADGVRRRVLVHRLAFAVANNGVDPALTLDHLCENKACVNPAHLEQVTSAENLRRHRARHPTTHCPNGHEYIEGSYYLLRDKGKRLRKDCKVCRAAKNAAYNARKKAEAA